MKSDTQKNLVKLPGMVALWADENGTPHEPWNKPATAHPIVVKAGETGYWKPSLKLDVDHFNSHAGEGYTPATRQQISAMLYGSMFGFDCPAADADRYNENGDMKPAEKQNASMNEMVVDVLTTMGMTDAAARVPVNDF